MSEPPTKWDPGKLPEWVRSALKASMDATGQSTPQRPDRNQLAWPLLVDAAVVAGFLPRDLAPGIFEGESRSTAENSVLGFAETMHDPGGLKWSLKSESRTAVLSEALRSGDVADALKRTAKQFNDPVSRALRLFLTGQGTESTALDLKTLEATRTAVSWLSRVPGLTLPGIDNLDREIELRRLLAPLERMIGQSAAGSDPSITHRFFGRQDELEQLRDYVGVIPAVSLTAVATRALSWVARTLKGRLPLAVWGVGGVGKTTLISKFVLEHAEAAVSRYPFAYLDFDRTTISARNRVGLIGEMCLQVGAQFDGLTQPMSDLRSRVSEFGTGSAEASDRDSISRLYPYIQEFRSLIDGHMQSLESRFEWARPFLLVLDTFEVVQYVPEDVVALEDFLSAFSFGPGGSLWSRMRLIVSGRKKVTGFWGRETENLPLGALDKPGSIEMLLALASGAGKSISAKDAQALVSVVAGATGERKGGVQPLRLRLIGEIFSKATEDGPVVVQSLRKEFEEPLTPGGIAGKILIDGILVRRIIGHVADPRVRALSDPGLVVRRITPEVIRKVMTLGTARPTGAAETPEDLDAEVKEPWIVDQAEASDIFEAFKREVSLVEIEGNALRHRPDVRQEMVPLIRARRPKRFAALHRLAFQHFLSSAEINPGDRASAAEAVYHGLWLGQPLKQLNSLWPDDPAFDPRIDAEEFPVGGIENIFVRARTRSVLTENELRMLPGDIARDWVIAHVPALLDRQRLDDSDLSVVRSVAGERFEALDDHPETGAVLARLLYRCGLWNDAMRLINRLMHRGKSDIFERSPEMISLKRTYLTVIAKSAGRISDPVARSFLDVETQRDPLVDVEFRAHAFLHSAREDADTAAGLREWVEQAARQVSRQRWIRELRILRLAILCRTSGVRELLELYLQSKEWFPRDRDLWLDQVPDWLVHAGAQEEFMKLREWIKQPKKQRGLEVENAFWRQTKERLARAIRKPGVPIADTLRLVIFDHSDWVRCLSNALTRALRTEQGPPLLNRLMESGFVEPGGRRAAAQGNGLEIVRAIFDEGRLLDFARVLPEWKEQILPTQSLARDERFSYPQDIYGLADALLKWHNALLDITGPAQGEEASQRR